MRFDWFLPELLDEADEETACEATTLHEYRHCGSKFGEKCDRCTVCDASEIATYIFSKDCNELRFRRQVRLRKR